MMSNPIFLCLLALVIILAAAVVVHQSHPQAPYPPYEGIVPPAILQPANR